MRIEQEASVGRLRLFNAQLVLRLTLFRRLFGGIRHFAPATVFVVAAACADANESGISLTDVRPNDAIVVAEARVPGGLAGGGAHARLLVSRSDFAVSRSAYEEYFRTRGGSVNPIFAGAGSRMEMEGGCISIFPWSLGSRNYAVSVLEPALDPDQAERLTATPGAYIEVEPNDCSYRG